MKQNNQERSTILRGKANSKQPQGNPKHKTNTIALERPVVKLPRGNIQILRIPYLFPICFILRSRILFGTNYFFGYQMKGLLQMTFLYKTHSAILEWTAYNRHGQFITKYYPKSNEYHERLCKTSDCQVIQLNSKPLLIIWTPDSLCYWPF